MTQEILRFSRPEPASLRISVSGQGPNHLGLESIFRLLGLWGLWLQDPEKAGEAPE